MAKIKNTKALQIIELFTKAGYRNVIYDNEKIYAVEKEYVIVDFLDNVPIIYFLTNF